MFVLFMLEDTDVPTYSITLWNMDERSERVDVSDRNWMHNELSQTLCTCHQTTNRQLRLISITSWFLIAQVIETRQTIHKI